jgi:uridylate kinase
VPKRYERVILKVSGESLAKPGELGIDPEELALLASEIADAYRNASPLQLAVVVGGGNIIRGARLAEAGTIDQSTADYMGMLGTVINGLALKEALGHVGIEARCMSGTSRRDASSSWSPAPATRSSPPTPAPACAASSSAPRPSSRPPRSTASTPPTPRRTPRPSATSASASPRRSRSSSPSWT